MFKKIMVRGISGMVLGVFIATFFSLLDSTFFGNGSFTFVAPYLVKKCESEIAAAWVMFILSGLIGFSYGATSLIFESEKLNLAVQTVLHNFINCPIMFAIGWICYWMPHSKSGVVIWFVIYFAIYVCIWLGFYLSYKSKVKQINEKLKDRK